MQEQYGQYRARFGASEVHRAALAEHLERSKDTKVHLVPGTTVTHPGAAGKPTLDLYALMVIFSLVTAAEALAQPTRREILDLLREGERPVGDLVELLDVSQPAVSKHLRVLREVGLVGVRADAQRRLYRVRPEPLAELDAWLAPYRRLWSSSLDALERHLDERND
jgi:DNA-binding transcriptional ArsR family regulator